MEIVERSSGFWLVNSTGVVDGPFDTEQEAKELLAFGGFCGECGNELEDDGFCHMCGQASAEFEDRAYGGRDYDYPADTPTWLA